MQTTTGQKLFSIPAILLLTVVASASLSVEKLTTPRASASTLRVSRTTPQSLSPDLKTVTTESRTVKADLKTVKADSKTAKTESRAAKILMMASWYGDQFQGRLTASGEIFDLKKLTAANKTLPLGTRVKLTAPSTGRSVVVRINDRGPWLKGRDLDLSEAAAISLGIHDKGVAAVEMALVQ
jgi:rare lipoprotein A (peptidoglycan hydrolase)